jgi:RNA polymerase sigma-70 factor (ECF subfamily)
VKEAQMNGELLVVRCQLGERDAFAELVRHWHPAVERYVRRMLAGPDDDVVQEVWLAVFRGLPRLRQPERFAPWLFTIARRAITNRLRDVYDRPESEPSEEAAGPEEIDAIADREVIGDALGALPVREREVLLLFYLEDLSLEACAQICGVPVGTVKSRLNRARKLLRDELTRTEYEA